MQQLKPFRDEDTLEIGVDEAGRGPLFGRVYTAAVIWPASLKDPPVLIDDSKRMRPVQLEESQRYIKKYALAYAVTYCDETEVDSMNILRATIASMHKSIKGCVLLPDNILVDGNQFDFYTDDDTGEIVSHTTIKSGDATYMSIAAASILAKYERDKYIKQLCQQYPKLDERYGISSNKGYGSLKHRQGILEHGISQFHRKSYKTCKDQQLNPV